MGMGHHHSKSSKGHQDEWGAGAPDVLEDAERTGFVQSQKKAS